MAQARASHPVSQNEAPLDWVLLPVFCQKTGYTKKAVYRKIENGVWRRGKHYQKAPDGHITMSIPAYYEWVQGEDHVAGVS